MGHSSIQVTLFIYGHLVPGANISFVDRLDALSCPQQSAIQPQQSSQREIVEIREVLEESVAGRQGLEPRYADPESAVLPLDDLPAAEVSTGVFSISGWSLSTGSSFETCDDASFRATKLQALI